jgi:hypothetical protein
MTAAMDALAALAEAFDRHDADAIAALYAPHATIRFAARPDLGVADIRDAYAKWFADEPDARVEVRAAFADDGLAMTEVTIVGGDQPVPLVVIVEVADGLIVAERQYAAYPTPAS